MGLGINYVILANHLVSVITSSITDPRLLSLRNTWHSKELYQQCIQKTHQCRHGVVQYVHRYSIEEDIVLNTHRNAKKLKIPYYETDPAVLDDIKQKAQHTNPKWLFKAFMDKAGGQLMSTSAVSEPRNAKHKIFTETITGRIYPSGFADKWELDCTWAYCLLRCYTIHTDDRHTNDRLESILHESCQVSNFFCKLNIWCW